MNIVITGVAGFIGSTLADKLLEKGHMVTGIDSIAGYYPERIKRANLAGLLLSPSFRFVECDLIRADGAIPGNTDILFHIAGQPGVRSSWGSDFTHYIHNNIEATQFLLEQVKRSGTLKKLIYASSSSVYGLFTELPLKETAVPHPVSPYGVSKLAAEHLCASYSHNFGIPTVALRYFSVYGPRQRPDMGFHRFFKAAMRDDPITIYGDGTQTRDFTFVDDIVAGTIKAAFSELPDHYTVMNIGSGRRIMLNDVLAMIPEITGKPLDIRYEAVSKGDVTDTFADIGRARDHLSYSPATELFAGLTEQYRWMSANRDILL